MKRNMECKVAFLWDESFLWGLMAHRALQNLGLLFDLVRADDIKNGCLKHYKMLFVPGGWASNKKKALSDKGTEAIREFVKNGGNYLGFCGGAGLATLDGIGLLNITRKPTKERVPSFSGRIYLNLNEHPVWKDFLRAEGRRQKAEVNSKFKTQNSKLVFHAWWPSQFVIKDKRVRVLATYGKALPDSFSSDLNAGDVEAHGGWTEYEKVYQIKLNPEQLLNEPALLEGRYGKGKVILSLIHFDTPEDNNGHQVLRNLWGYLGGKQRGAEARKCGSAKAKTSELPSFRASELFALCSDLISLGERNFLWFRRNPMLLQWRRGVRGLEYNTLYIMIKEIVRRTRINVGAIHELPLQMNDLNSIKNLLISFTEKAKKLLILERYALQKGHITYEKCDDPEIQKMRAELFSGSKSHGGMFKELIDEVDKVLFSLIK
ncbi:MAG: hypothetical protein HZB30_04040 [Nitrospirae bacterium]|nr:hypothetical protein [Nitrospirota bacterium]